MNAGPDHSLFPPIEPRRMGMLPVDALHTLYWEESGNPDGIPVVYVHGGPGGGSSPGKRQWFDPDSYRIILFDQRGAFRSTPVGEVRANTTQLLVEDMEVLRKMLGVEQWLLAGGSWGTTLSLAYAQTHPEACLGLVLRGVFLGTASEIDWFLHGMRLFFPHAHDDFVGWIPQPEADDVLTAYEKRLFGDDPRARRMRRAGGSATPRTAHCCATIRRSRRRPSRTSRSSTAPAGWTPFTSATGCSWTMASCCGTWIESPIFRR